MSKLRIVELKPFVPARDYELSKRFYQDLGFTLASDADGVAYFHHETVSFLLQDFYLKELAENLMLHLLVESRRVAGEGGGGGDRRALWRRGLGHCGRSPGACGISRSPTRPACCGGSGRMWMVSERARRPRRHAAARA